MDTTAYLQSAQQGSLEAFNQLVLAYQDRLFNAACGMLHDEAPAADAVQNTLLRAFRSLPTYRGGSFDGWLFRILKNACYDELRRQKRQPTQPLEPVDDEGEEYETSAWLRDPAQDPAGQVEAAELAGAIERGLQSLSPEYRLALVLVDIEGLEYAEAAQAASVPVGTIRSRLARARQRLSWELRQQPELLPEVYTRAWPAWQVSALATG
jgi:RNA polymerase sigma-70 factor (ECF subfamily)